MGGSCPESTLSLTVLTIVICLVLIGVACVAVLRITLEDENQPATAPRQRHRAPDAPAGGSGEDLVDGAEVAPPEVDTTDRLADVVEEPTPSPEPDTAEIPLETTAPLPSETTAPVPNETAAPLPSEETAPVPSETAAPRVDALAADQAVTAVLPVTQTARSGEAPNEPARNPFGGTSLPDVDHEVAPATGWPDDLDDEPVADITAPLVLPGSDEPTTMPTPLVQLRRARAREREPLDEAPPQIRQHPTARRSAVAVSRPEQPAPEPVETRTQMFAEDGGEVAPVILTPIDSRRRLRSTVALLVTLTLVGCLLALAIVATLGLLLFGVREAISG
jgi:hypothetical protein